MFDVTDCSTKTFEHKTRDDMRLARFSLFSFLFSNVVGKATPGGNLPATECLTNHSASFLSMSYNALCASQLRQNVNKNSSRVTTCNVSQQNLQQQHEKDSSYSGQRLELGMPGYNVPLFNDLCTRANTEPVNSPLSTTSKLRCFCQCYGDLPCIAPFKIEALNLQPKVVLIKNVISNLEIATLMEVADPEFINGETLDDDTSYRNTQVAWLDAAYFEIVRQLYKRLESATGLNMETAEPLQVARYPVGGHYYPHVDFDTSPANGEGIFYPYDGGNRVATMLLYGDALFWYNLHEDGVGDLTTEHAACPVVSGRKWVANAWLHERGQEFKRPCKAGAYIDPH